jgi:NAD(P)-dependent dehydrogenase (short-subunit alcohol dehydrogenase family)
MFKVAIITGVRRIGFYLARFLLQKGYHLAVFYKSSTERVKELQKTATERNLKVLPFRVDLSEPESYIPAVEEVFIRLGRIDLLMNVASPFERASLLQTDVETFRKSWTSIVEASFFLTREVARFMKQTGGGKVINFGDWAASSGRPYRNFAAYLVAKGGLDTLTRVAALELAPDVTVNQISLGPVLPPAVGGKEIKEGWNDYVERNTLFKRPVPPEDITAAVEFFLKTSTVTGEIILIDAGQKFVGKSGA